jgi:peptidoglycan/LPS O-acetylase OafA/YrhL
VAMALVYLGGRGKLVLLERWPWLFLGSVSYALYVSHHWLGVTVMRAADRAGHGGWQGFVLAGVVCLLVAQALTVWVERPGLKLLRGVFAR